MADPRKMQAAWGLETRLQLARQLCEFFSPLNLEKGLAAVGKNPPGASHTRGLTLMDFISCHPVLSGTGRQLNVWSLSELVDRMVSVGLLARLNGPPGVIGVAQSQYLRLGVTYPRGDSMDFVLAIGPDLLYRLFAPSLVHIAGMKGVHEHAGTGIVVDNHHVLTCRHVVDDMEVNPQQIFQGYECGISVKSIHRHPEIDMAVMQMDGPPLTSQPDLVLRPPIVGQSVFALGYPKLPCFRRAPLTMQQGAVTNHSVISLGGESLFLYSAIARPGNSGGAVISEDGYLLGMSIADATVEYHDQDPFSPHYVGVPSQVLLQALDDLKLGIQLKFQTYE